MIIANRLDLKYSDGTMGLKDVSLVIPTGEIIYITGPSGSGKTSFLKLLIGMEKPSAGTLTVLGNDMNSINNKNLRDLRQSIGPIFQDFRILDGRTVLENVLTGLRFLNFSNMAMKDNTIKAIEKVGLAHKTNSLVNNLSYGERQRVSIARAVARKPSLIIADEPTGNLDVRNSLNILGLLKSFKDSNTSVIITTHATHLIEEETDCMKIVVTDGQMRFKEVSYEQGI